MSHSENKLASSRDQIKRLLRQLERAEARNADLREQLERAALGQVKAWTPFEKCNSAVGPDGTLHQLSDEAASVWRNSLYTVSKWDRQFEATGGLVLMVTHLSIKRNDGAAVRDWRHFQRIKNELCGAEREGVEIFPAESRLVDGANQFHVWVLPEGQRVPFGFETRLVSADQNNGVQQRQWEPGQEPEDLRNVTGAAMAEALQRRGILGG